MDVHARSFAAGDDFFNHGNDSQFGMGDDDEWTDDDDDVREPECRTQ